MNKPKCSDLDYINYLVASLRAVSGTEVARAQPPQADPPAHDAFTCLLHRLEPEPNVLWANAVNIRARLRSRGRERRLFCSLTDPKYKYMPIWVIMADKVASEKLTFIVER